MTIKLKRAKDLKVGDKVAFGEGQDDRTIAKVTTEGDFVHVKFDDEGDGHLSAAKDSQISVKG